MTADLPAAPVGGRTADEATHPRGERVDAQHHAQLGSAGVEPVDEVDRQRDTIHLLIVHSTELSEHDQRLLGDLLLTWADELLRRCGLPLADAVRRNEPIFIGTRAVSPHWAPV